MAEIEEKPQSLSAAMRRGVRRFLRHENAVLALILVAIIAILAGLTDRLTVTRGNITNVWLQSSTRGIAAMGQTFVILTAGIDLSVGGIGLVAAILGASLMTGQATVPVSAVVIMFLLGIGVGAFNGTLVSRVGMPALIVTLGVWEMTKGGGFLICRGITFRNLPEGLSFFGSGEIAGVPVPVIIFISVAVVSYFVLYHTPFGRSVYATGGNPVSAWLSGVNVKRTLFLVYVISALLGTLSGFVLMARTMTGGMNTVVNLELDSIAAVVIGGVSLAGGRGTVIGAVIGVLMLGIINNGMNVFALDPAYQSVVKGAIIVVAVAADYWRRR